MTRYWTCIKLACVIIPVPAATIGAYMLVHPVPSECRVDCHWVIPPEEWSPGGFFYPPHVTPPEGMEVPTPLGFTPGLYASAGVPLFDVVERHHHHHHPETHYAHHHAPAQDVPEPSGGFLAALAMLAVVKMGRLVWPTS